MTPFTLSPTKTPDVLTPTIRQACARLVPRAEAVFVAKQPFPGARINKCTFNVREYLRENPGDMVLGWDVTIWDGVLLDCIGHAVVRSGNSFLCVTPSKYPEQRLLFLPDPSLTFNFEDENARMPVREVALSSRPEVAKLIEVTRLEREIKVKYAVSSQPLLVQGPDAVELQRLSQAKSQLMLRAILVTADHNSRCPCGSGKKFRKCHRTAVEHMLS